MGDVLRRRLGVVLRRGAIFFVAPALGVVVPAYYDATTRLPPPAQWQVTQGPLEVVVPANQKYHGVISTLRIAGQDFQCAGSWLQPSNCLPNPREHAALQGQPAQVTWFAQTVFPGMTRARVIELQVGDRVVISRRWTQRLLAAAHYPLWRLWGLTVLGALLILGAGVGVVAAQERHRQREPQTLPVPPQ